MMAHDSEGRDSILGLTGLTRAQLFSLRADKEFSGSASTLAPHLTAMVTKGLLPINALPSINGSDSSDEVLGWGGLDGRVYQKAYVEFFAPAEEAAKIIGTLQGRVKGSPGKIDFIAVDAKGVSVASEGLAPGKVSAVSWGVFPGKETIQPYVVDGTSVKARAAEAFALWTTEWGSLYEEGSASLDVLKKIASGYTFIGVIDHDYVAGGDLISTL